MTTEKKTTAAKHPNQNIIKNIINLRKSRDVRFNVKMGRYEWLECGDIKRGNTIYHGPTCYAYPSNIPKMFHEDVYLDADFRIDYEIA